MKTSRIILPGPGNSGQDKRYGTQKQQVQLTSDFKLGEVGLRHLLVLLVELRLLQASNEGEKCVFTIIVKEECIPY